MNKISFVIEALVVHIPTSPQDLETQILNIRNTMKAYCLLSGLTRSSVSVAKN